MRRECQWKADLDPCPYPAVDYIERLGKRRWFCAAHFDMWSNYVNRQKTFFKDLKAKKA